MIDSLRIRLPTVFIKDPIYVLSLKHVMHLLSLRSLLLSCWWQIIKHLNCARDFIHLKYRNILPAIHQNEKDGWLCGGKHEWRVECSKEGGRAPFVMVFGACFFLSRSLLLLFCSSVTYPHMFWKTKIGNENSFTGTCKSILSYQS